MRPYISIQKSHYFNQDMGQISEIETLDSDSTPFYQKRYGKATHSAYGRLERPARNDSHQNYDFNSKLSFLPNSKKTQKYVMGALYDSIRENRLELAEKENWRHRLGRFLESQKMQVIIISFVLFDFAIVMAEIIISFMEMEGGMPLNESIMEPLRFTSIAILSVFVLENVLKLVAFGVKYFVFHPMHLLDVVLIFTSLFLTIFLHGPAQEVIGLLILLRTWRIVRVIEAVVLTVHFRHKRFSENLQQTLFQKRVLLAAARGKLFVYESLYGKLKPRDYEKLYEII